MRLLSVFPAAMLLASCAASQGAAPDASIAEPQIPKRDLAAAAAALQGSSVVDVSRFQPVQTIGESCSVRALPTGTVDSAELQAAMQAAQDYSDAHKGVALLVMRNGKLLHETYAETIDQASVVDAFSMHKSLLSLVAGAAVDDGIIASIDTPIEPYVPEWKGDPRGQITLRELLTMSSGLTLFSMGAGSPEAMELLLGADINSAALAHTLSDDPGSVFRYNNVNSQVAGLVLSRALSAAGKGDYGAYLEQRIWCPLGNGRAKLWLDREGGAAHYYSGLFTQPRSWARIGELIREGGTANGERVISTTWLTDMAAPSTANPGYGLHVWRGTPWKQARRYSSESPIAIAHKEPYAADDVLFFDGFGGQRVYVVPSAGLTIMRSGEVDLTYDDSVIVNTILAAL